MKTPNNRFLRLLLDSAWFPALAWLAAVGGFLGVSVVWPPVRHWCGKWAADGLSFLAFAMVAVLSVSGLVAFVRSLWRGRWGRAAVQLLLGGVAVVLAAVGGAGAFLLSWEVAVRTPGGVPWRSTAPDAPMPFAVEYRRAHPFLAEYDKRIAFASGRRFGLYPDCGGEGDCAVYVLDSGRYAIAEGLRPAWDFRVYRIDPEAETVDFLRDGVWFTLPPDTLRIDGWGRSGERRHVIFAIPDGTFAATNGIPAGDEFAHRRYLGLVTPDAVFTPPPPGSPADPWAEILAD